jgi:type II secretory pathway pseudopilin PulG
MNKVSVARFFAFKTLSSTGFREGELCKSPPLSSAAHSLIELIGVVAIITIIVATAMPVMVRRADLAAYQKEQSNLAAISNAFVLQALKTRYVPGSSTWASSVANWTMRSTYNIATNDRRYGRLYLYDKDNWMTNAGTGGYTQTTNGTVQPVSARVVIVSTIAGPRLPAIGPNQPNGNFNKFWDAAPNTVPAPLAAWTGSGQDLLIQRINLNQIFDQLILISRDTNNAAGFLVDGNLVPVTVGAGGMGWNSYYIDGTVLGLVSNNVSSSTLTLQTRLVLKQSTSYIFEGGYWYGQTVGGNSTTNIAQNFTSTAAAFFGSNFDLSGQSHGSAVVCPSALVGSMCNFMLAYTMWANMTPHFNNFGVTPIDKLQVWDLLDIEGVASHSSNPGNIDYFSNKTTGLLQ